MSFQKNNNISRVKKVKNTTKFGLPILFEAINVPTDHFKLPEGGRGEGRSGRVRVSAVLIFPSPLRRYTEFAFVERRHVT